MVFNAVAPPVAGVSGPSCPLWVSDPDSGRFQSDNTEVSPSKSIEFEEPKIVQCVQ